VSWEAVLEHSVQAAVVAAISYTGAYLRFKHKLRESERALKTVGALQKRVEALPQSLELVVQTAISELREELERDAQQAEANKEKLERAVAEARDSRPDPVELLKDEVDRNKRDIQRLKEGRSRYVHTSTFKEFVASQEDQWRTLMKAVLAQK
jgi:hypothetical protein